MEEWTPRDRACPPQTVVQEESRTPRPIPLLAAAWLARQVEVEVTPSETGRNAQSDHETITAAEIEAFLQEAIGSADRLRCGEEGRPEAGGSEMAVAEPPRLGEASACPASVPDSKRQRNDYGKVWPEASSSPPSRRQEVESDALVKPPPLPCAPEPPARQTGLGATGGPRIRLPSADVLEQEEIFAANGIVGKVVGRHAVRHEVEDVIAATCN